MLQSTSLFFLIVSFFFLAPFSLVYTNINILTAQKK